MHRFSPPAFILILVQINLLYFGILKDLFARERESLDLPEGALVEDALRLLRVRASNVQENLWSTMAVAINLEYVPVSTALHEGDELALLPPVSGGLA